MKKTSLVLILLFFIINLVFHVGVYYGEVDEFYNSPSVMFSDGNYLYAAFDTGKNIAVVRCDEDGRIDDASFVSKGSLFSEEIAEVESIAARHNQLYILWNYRDSQSGNIVRQELEAFNSNKIRTPLKNNDILLETDLSDGYKLNNIYISSQGDLSLSGISTDKRYAVYFALDKENNDLIDKTQYLIDGGAYRSFAIRDEKYCVSISGSLMGIRNGGMTVVYDGLARNISPQTDGSVFFQDIAENKLYQLKNNTVKPYTNFPIEEALPYYETELIDMSIHNNGISFFKMADVNSGDIYYLSGTQDGIKVIPQFNLNFTSLLQVTFFQGIIQFIIGCLIIVLLTVVYYKWLKSKNVSIRILVSLIPVFAVIYCIFAFFMVLNIQNKVVTDYQTKATEAAEYLAKSYEVYDDSLDEADQELFAEKISSDLSEEFAASRTIIVREAGEQYLVIDTDYDCFFERPEKLYSTSLTDFIKNVSILKENGPKVYQDKAFVDGVYSVSFSDSGRGVYISGYDCGLLYGVFIGELYKILLPALAAFLMIFAALAVVLRIQLKPISVMRTEMEEWSKGNYSRLTVSKKSSEVFDIVRILNGSVNDFTAKIYQLSRLNSAYFRFVPQNIIKILERESVVDVEAGDKKVFAAPVAYFLMMQSSNVIRSDEQRFEYSNRYFSILNSVLKDYQSMFALINDDLTKITATFDSKTSDLLSLAKRLINELEYFNKHTSESIITPLIVIAKPEVTLAMAGDESRITPMLITAESSTVDIIYNTFEFSGCEVILLQSAFKDIDVLDNNDYRYIGYMEIENESKIIGMYDYFAASAEKTVKIKRETLPLFNDAMMAFYAGDFEKAKQLYSKVLDIDGKDGIARWYLFRCYEYENKGDSIDVSYALIKKKNFKGFDR